LKINAIYVFGYKIIHYYSHLIISSYFIFIILVYDIVWLKS